MGLALEKINATRVFFVERGRGQGASVNVKQSRQMVLSKYRMAERNRGGEKVAVLCSLLSKLFLFVF